jgi:hypothetical protein
VPAKQICTVSEQLYRCGTDTVLTYDDGDVCWIIVGVVAIHVSLLEVCLPRECGSALSAPRHLTGTRHSAGGLHVFGRHEDAAASKVPLQQSTTSHYSNPCSRRIKSGAKSNRSSEALLRSEGAYHMRKRQWQVTK